ncbi:MAG: ABC transporter permease [gamma proteobacterium symbiont of Bathyaustriella thionipta]|nr:ABC transporter permease [gamma proteobacterium symbiont of Bathyaustriella thionipta]
MPVVLWTDALIYLLLAAALLGIFLSRRHPHLSAPFKHIVHSRVGVASGIILLAYAAIGFLDTLHFHPALEQSNAQGEAMVSQRILSVLDILTDSLRQHSEKTYSQPFAMYAYVKESSEMPDGRIVREYPRLKWGGAHLNDAQEKTADIIHKSIIGVVIGLLFSMLCSLLITGLLAWRKHRTLKQQLTKVWRNQTELPWRLILLLLSLLIVMASLSGYLSQFYHIMGTDKVGEDVFYQALKSIRTGLVIGTITTLIMLPGAIILGLMAGYFRGWIDDLVQYLYTTLNSIPGVLLIAAAVLMLDVYMTNNAELFDSVVQRADLRLLFLCVILGVTSWTGLCRLLRAETLKLREMEYIQASQAFGVNHFMILLRHLLPNVMHIVFITIVLDFSGLVLAEAVLSYINIGVDPSTNSWGNMINSARLELARVPVVWWSLSAALVFMFVLVLSANLFSDVVRDAFDPRMRKPS